MNISIPVHNDTKEDFFIEDEEIINKSLIVADKLVGYLDDLTVLVKNTFANSKDSNKHQRKLHGLAWVATYVEALKQMSIWADRLFKTGNFSRTERLILI